MKQKPKENISLPTKRQVETERKRYRRQKAYNKALRGTVYVLTVVAAVAVLIATLILPVLQIEGTSMEPTLSNGNIVLLTKTTRFDRGDLCGFTWNNKLLIKRVIGLPGDWIEIDTDGTIYLNGEILEEPYVIPTDIEGVYIYDDLKAEGQLITGQNKQTARELYAAYLAGYENNTQKNTVVTPKNGKIVIVGLKKGTYYYKETVPPAGYNALSKIEAIEITDEKTGNIFYIYANEAGKVDNIQAPNSTYSEKKFTMDVATVRNSKGVELPSTGGEGTFWLIAIGTAMVICFAVFLITHKKMSVYTD